MKISVIVPVYRAENFLRRCIDSILTQTFSNIELLLIDDGSPDRSGEICDEYAEKDNRVRVIHKKNGGVSSARNMGLDHLTGDFFMFVDADDYLSLDALEKLAAKQKETTADIVTGKICKLTNETTYYICEPAFSSAEEMLFHLVSQVSNHENVARLIRTDVVTKNSLRFLPDIKIGEDWLFLVQITLHVHKIAQIDDLVYVYDYTNEASAMHNITKSQYKWNLADIIVLSEMKKELVDMPSKFMVAINHLILAKADDGLIGAAYMKDKMAFNSIANYVGKIDRKELKTHLLYKYTLLGKPNYRLCSMYIASSVVKNKIKEVLRI